MTYSLTRFAIYETVRDQVTKGSAPSLEALPPHLKSHLREWREAWHACPGPWLPFQPQWRVN